MCTLITVKHFKLLFFSLQQRYLEKIMSHVLRLKFYHLLLPAKDIEEKPQNDWSQEKLLQSPLGDNFCVKS
jgi:hypothetical protein